MRISFGTAMPPLDTIGRELGYSRALMDSAQGQQLGLPDAIRTVGKVSRYQQNALSGVYDVLRRQQQDILDLRRQVQQG